MAGYHISVAARNYENHVLVSVRVHETIFYVHTNCTVGMVEDMARSLFLATYKHHFADGLEFGSEAIAEDDDELFMLLLGLSANRRKRAA
jgi:hypothetical protein